MEAIKKEINRHRLTAEFDLKFYRDVNDEFMNWHIDRFRKFTQQLSFLTKGLTIKGVKIASKYTRVVTGGHGPYIEFTEEDLLFKPVTKKGQEWRTEPKYAHCKYEWLTHPELDIKIYKQKHKVKYADYVPGMFYIDALLFDGIGLRPEGSAPESIDEELDATDLL